MTGLGNILENFINKNILAEQKLDFFTETDTLHLVNYIKEKYDPSKPLFLWIDLFCGCGGITEGFSRNDNTFIVACVNHDPYAIKSHHANHPYCIHYTEDIRDWHVIYKIQSLIEFLRKEFPNAVIGLHASLECTHFSKAKGGMSRDADSRTLGEHLYKYLCISPDYITIENVEEFLHWGPMYQVSKKVKGIVQWKYETKKKKILWMDKPFDDMIAYCTQNDITPFELAIKEKKGEYYDRWVAEFEKHGYHYDYRKLNAADFGEYTSRSRYFGVFAKKKLPIEFPTPTHVTKKKHHLYPHLKVHNPVRDKLNLLNEGLSLFGFNKKGKEYVEATFWRVYYGLLKYHKEGYFTIRYNGGDMSDKNNSINNPLGTILTNNTHSLVKPIFLTSYYGSSKEGNGVHSLEEPCNTITTKDRFALHHIQYAFGKPMYSKLDEPANTITTNPKHELVTTKWLYDTQFDRVGMSVDKPCPTIIARQDKKPLYLASTRNHSLIDNSIPHKDDDEVKIRLKIFMRANNITDILIRSLELDELKRIQGFPEDYVLHGGKTRAMKYIGNSVCPKMSEAFSGAIYKGMEEYLKIAI